jgi:hypothetical protein
VVCSNGYKEWSLRGVHVSKQVHKTLTQESKGFLKVGDLLLVDQSKRAKGDYKEIVVVTKIDQKNRLLLYMHWNKGAEFERIFRNRRNIYELYS